MSTTEKSRDLRIRTRQFALRIIRLYAALPKRVEAQVIGKQLLRSGTSIGAQYHEGTRSRSNQEFISKLQSSLQEAEETNYWLLILSESGFMAPGRLTGLLGETDELIAMLTSSVKRVKTRIKPKDNQ